jgi:hypothetical protein
LAKKWKTTMEIQCPIHGKALDNSYKQAYITTNRGIASLSFAMS